MRVLVYDMKANDWRDFEVVPLDLQFQPKCSVWMHQLHIGWKFCACGKVAR